MSAAGAVAVAVTFVWLGMVLAISFLEAPLKFRAPGVTLPVGLGIGRLVFRALNACETFFAVILLGSVVLGGFGAVELVAGGIALLTLVAQLVLVRPRLTKRSDAVLAGLDAPRSRAHLVYVALELVKVTALLVGGISLLV